MARLYDDGGAGDGSLNRCPGETDCEMFELAAGETHEDKERNACRGCHLLSSKPAHFERVMTDDEAEVFIAEVERIRRVRDSGGGVDLTAISYLSWRLLMILDDATEAHERNLRLYAKGLFEALAKRGI